MRQETQTEMAVTPMLLTVEQAMKQLQVGRSKFYRMVNQEGLPIVRSGRWVRIYPDALRQWIEQRQQRSA